MVQGVELNYNTSASAMQMAQHLFGAGVTVVGAGYTGDPGASAIYSGGDSISPGVTPGDSGVILSTGQANRFTNNSWQSNLSSSTTSSNSGPGNVSGFTQAAGTSTYDASFLDVSFVPDPGVTSISIKFVFSSDEYPEYSNSIYNDLMMVWSNGQPVPISVGNGQVSVGNINQLDSANLFVNNTGDQYNTEMDGFTLTLSLDIPVVAGQVNTLRIGLTDVADANYDSNLLIAADSIQGALVAADDLETITAGGTKTFDPLANDSSLSGASLTITHVNGIAVVAGDTVNLSTGQTVTLNADGTFTVTADQDIETVHFTYTANDGAGHDDVAIVTIDTIPCFVSGTRILTPVGEVAVERLRPGDLVETCDRGAQPVVWAGTRRVAARGTLAPIRIEAGTLGEHRTLLVSPQHRVLIAGPRAELLFGEAEVLVAAKHLVDGHAIRPVEGGTVVYVHLLFDRHEILRSEGLPTESLLPGEMALGSVDPEAREELLGLFPDGDGPPLSRYGAAARRILRSFEARALLGARLAG